MQGEAKELSSDSACDYESLVGGDWNHGILNDIQLGIILPTDELHHFSEG